MGSCLGVNILFFFLLLETVLIWYLGSTVLILIFAEHMDAKEVLHVRHFFSFK